MGRKFHRKQLPTEHGRTSGTGIRYEDGAPITPSDVVAARAARREDEIVKEQHQQAADLGVSMVMDIASTILDTWKEAMAFNDERVAHFVGWYTTDDHCEWPLDDDDDIAAFYHDQITWMKAEANRPLTVDDLDKLIHLGFPRQVPLVIVVERAMKEFRLAAQRAVNHEGVDLNMLTTILGEKVTQPDGGDGYDNDLASALGFLVKNLNQINSNLEEGQQ